MLPVASTFPLFIDLDGTPVSSGFAYFGTPNLNPETNPIGIFWDIDGQVPANNPVSIINGQITRAGTVSTLFVNQDYSLTVRNAANKLVYSVQSVIAAQAGNIGVLTGRETQTATAGQTVFALQSISYAVGSKNLVVVINGLLVSDYTETNPTVVTFNQGLSAGDEVVFLVGSPFAGSGTINSSVVQFTPSGTGAVSTTVQAKLLEFVSVRDRGAVGDGITDDTAAFQAILDDGVLGFVPRGNYFISSSLAYTLTATADIGFIGEGPEASRLIFASGAGITITKADSGFSDGDRNTIRLEKIGLETQGAGTASGLTTVNTAAGSGYALDLTISDVRLSGTTPFNYWTEAIHLESPTFINCRDVLVQGDGTNGVGIRLDSSIDAVDNTFRNIRVHSANTAIYVTGRLEGVYIDQLITLAGTQYGVRWEATLNHGESKQPLLVLANSHINTSLYAVKLVDIAQALINNCLFYVANIAATPTYGVHMTSTGSVANSFNQIGRTTFIGIGSKVGASSTGVFVGADVTFSNIDAVIDNFNTGVDSAAGVGTFIAPSSRITNFDNRASNMAANGSAFKVTDKVNVNGEIQLEDVQGTTYDRNFLREQLRVGTHVHTVVGATDNVDITLSNAFRTDTLGGVVCFGSGTVSGARVDLDLGNSTSTTIRAVVNDATPATQVRINYIVYGA